MELLVVISIIALLLAILLPGLSKAKAAARAIQCMSGQHQSMLAIQMYSNDYQGWGMASDGWQPFVSGGPPACAARAWADTLMLQGYLPNVMIRSTSLSYGTPSGSCLVQSEVPPRNAFSCPSMPLPSVVAAESMTFQPGQAAGSWSFGIRTSNMYSSLGEQWKIGGTGLPTDTQFYCWFPRMSSLLNDRVYLADTIGGPYLLGTRAYATQGAGFYTGPTVSYSSTVQRRHGDKANIAFPDGHTASLGERDLLNMVPEAANQVYSVPANP